MRGSLGIWGEASEHPLNHERAEPFQPCRVLPALLLPRPYPAPALNTNQMGFLPSSFIFLFLLWKEGMLMPPKFNLQEDVAADGNAQLQGLSCGDTPLVPRAGTLCLMQAGSSISIIYIYFFFYLFLLVLFFIYHV